MKCLRSLSLVLRPL